MTDMPRILDDRRGSFEISCDPARLQLDRIHAFLTEIYWSRGIDRETVARALRHSFTVGVYADGCQVGLSRVVTDYTTFAYLTDVYVEPAHQGHGLGAWMVEFILAHPDLQGLRRFLLLTRDAKGLYAKFGFGEPRNPERFMELVPPR